MIVTFDKGIALSEVNVRNIANRPKLVLNAWNFKLVFLIVKYFNLKITINTSKEKKDLKNIISITVISFEDNFTKVAIKEKKAEANTIHMMPFIFFLL